MNPTDIPTRTRHFVLYEARRITSYDALPTHFLNGWRSEHMPQGGRPHFLTTAPRDCMDGLPRDWWIDVEEIFVAASVPLVGKVWLEQNDDTVHVVPFAGHDAHALQETNTLPFTRLKGSDGAGAHDAFELRLEATVTDTERPPPVDIAPLRATVQRLLERFDHLHPEAKDEKNYMLWSHRQHIRSLFDVDGPWVLVGLAGRARVVVV